MTPHTPGPHHRWSVRLLTRFDALSDELHSPLLGRRVPGTIPVAVIAALASLAASLYFVPNHFSLAYPEALNHLTIARAFVDNIGGPWLDRPGAVGFPLPPLVLVPFVSISGLWQSGWGAALLGAACLAATAAAVYRTAVRWGLHGLGRLTVVAAVVANPAMLYLYATALTEPVLITAMAGCFAGLANWATRQTRPAPARLALFAGVPAAAAALSREEGWSLVIVGAVYVAAVAWQGNREAKPVARQVLAFVAAPLLAISCWFLATWVSSGDPLALPRWISTRALAPDPLDPGPGTPGHLLLSISTLNVAAVNSVGFGLVALAAAGLVVVLLSDRTPRLRGFLALMLSTYAFLAISLFTGQAVILNDANSADLWNNRSGMSTILAFALMAACGVDLAARSLADRGRHWVTAAQVGVAIVAAGALVVPNLWVAPAPAERSLVLAEAATQLAIGRPSREAAQWLGAHYDGGRILIDETVPRNHVLPLPGLTLREYYLRADGARFDAALADLAGHARWIWVSDDPGDLVARAVAADQGFGARYGLAYAGGGTRLYRRTA